MHDVFVDEVLPGISITMYHPHHPHHPHHPITPDHPDKDYEIANLDEVFDEPGAIA